jgi:hypothetical protein
LCDNYEKTLDPKFLQIQIQNPHSEDENLICQGEVEGIVSNVIQRPLPEQMPE